EEPYAGKPHVRFWKGLYIAKCVFTKHCCSLAEDAPDNRLAGGEWKKSKDMEAVKGSAVFSAACTHVTIGAW
ncbi:hypothetical protein EAI89_21775, partial [Eubacterium sp. am_0171]|uniref:hypothetical protein n=1 Tax=Clostridia TaxID=186801 RepID=UPI0010D5ABC2